MKYGLLYYKETDNIGDDIQTYAAKRFLPSVDYYIDRENLNCFIPDKREYVSVIMNAWYLHNKAAWPPSPFINPLLISMHFTEQKELDVGDEYLKGGVGAQYLKDREPIGARDSKTQKRLEKNGIKNYFSGCMTLTINKFENIKKEDYICLVDVPEKIVDKIKSVTKREVKIITHNCIPEEIKNKSVEDRLKDVEDLLKMYQKAHLVITDRLHAMLPSMALETPVILLHKDDYEEDRLGDFVKYVKSFSFKEFLKKDIKDDIEKPSKNNEEYKKIREKLESKVKEFIENNDKIEDNKLPKIDDYKEYVEKISYYKNLYESLRKRTLENYNNYKKELEEVWNSKEEGDNYLKNIIKEKDNVIREKNLELEQVYNSVFWKMKEKIKKKK